MLIRRGKTDALALVERTIWVGDNVGASKDGLDRLPNWFPEEEVNALALVEAVGAYESFVVDVSKWQPFA